MTFGTIGRIVPHKRHVDLLQALRILCERGVDADLVVAGEGPIRTDMVRRARSLGIADRVTFTGEFESLDEVMAAIDIFVLTSASESQSMPVTEAMAYGKPVVATRFGGIPDFVDEGVTGLLVPVGDLERLAAAMERLAADPPLRQEMGRQGRARYVLHYRPSLVADAIERLYGELWYSSREL